MSIEMMAADAFLMAGNSAAMDGMETLIQNATTEADCRNMMINYAWNRVVNVDEFNDTTTIAQALAGTTAEVRINKNVEACMGPYMDIKDKRVIDFPQPAGL